MGVKAVVSGYTFPVRTFSITEDSTPLSAGDTSGGTGTLNLTLSGPDPDLEHVQSTGMKYVLDNGSGVLIGTTVNLDTSRWGSIEGTVTSVSTTGISDISLTATTKLNQVNVYNVQSQPFVGTLGDALAYYMGLASLTGLDFEVDSTIAPRYVTLPGWTGELWFHLKQLAAVQMMEIALVDNVVVFRPIRMRTVPGGGTITASLDNPVPTLAQSVEVAKYNHRAITAELVYPPGGWTSEVEVMNVNAGETQSYPVQLSASVSSIVQPTLVENVPPELNWASRYTVVANDGLPVPPALWYAHGGSLTVSINEDTTSLTVTIIGATGLPLTDGDRPATNFSIALGSDVTGNRYSTLRILGSGVAFNREVKKIRTGVPASQAPTDVGTTIDNIFISTTDDLYRTGTLAAQRFAYPIPEISRDLTEVLLRGDSAWNGGTLGNVSGARIFDKKTQRPYRIRTSSLSGTVNVSAEDDLTIGEVDDAYDGLTYADVQARYEGLTYVQAERKGLLGA